MMVNQKKEPQLYQWGVESKMEISIALVDFDGNEIFKGSDYAITGDRELSAEESFKLGKFLMKIPSMQRFLKGEISKDEFKPVS